MGIFSFLKGKGWNPNGATGANEDPTVAPSSQLDSEASQRGQTGADALPLRDSIQAAAKAELQSRASRLSWFEWIFFLYSLTLCTFLLWSIHCLSSLYFEGHLLEKLGEFRDWHILFASDAIFAGLTLIFMTVFLSNLKMISNNAQKIKKDANEENLTDIVEDTKSKPDCVPSYFYNIIGAIKDLATAIKGIPK